MPVVLFTTSTTWVAPAGVTSVIAECWGGGGGGGGASNIAITAGSGGTGGGYARKTIPVTPGVTYTVNVGLGGTGGSIAGGNGNFGGNSWFSNSSIILAHGGSPGIGSTTNATTPLVKFGGLNIGDIIYDGGASGLGAPGNWSGGGGGGAGSTGFGGSAPELPSNVNQSFGLGTSELGGNGAIGRNSNGPGNIGFNYGGGGGGGYRNSGGSGRAGGAGAPGLVRLTFSPSTSTPIFIQWIDDSDY